MTTSIVLFGSALICQPGKIVKSTSSIFLLSIKSRSVKKVDVGNFVVDNKKLRKLGWKVYNSIEEGVSKTLDYFKNQKD